MGTGALAVSAVDARAAAALRPKYLPFNRSASDPKSSRSLC